MMKGTKFVMAAALVGLGGCAVDESADEATAMAEQAATTVDVWTGTWNGSSANAYDYYSPLSGGYVDVFENKGSGGQTRRAFLNFSRWSVDPTSEQCFDWTDWWGYTYHWCYYTRSTYTYGWGEIPQQDAQFTGNNARVRTTLPASFAGYVCTYDWSNWTSDPCTSAAGGEVDLVWHNDGNYSSFFSGTSQNSYGSYTFKSQGTSRWASAQANGTILGTTFSAPGSFGTSRGTNVSKSVFKTPNP